MKNSKGVLKSEQDPFIDILTMKMNMVQMPEVVDAAMAWIREKRYGSYIAVCNAYDAVCCKKDPAVREAVNNSSLTVPDGISMVKVANLYGYPLKRRVYGPDLMQALLSSGENRESPPAGPAGKIENELRHFFYGTTDDTLEKLEKNLKEKYPRFIVAGKYAPPFRPLTPEEDKKVIDMINDAAPDILWVGLGCPRQQIWMYEHKDSLKVPVMVGVGAAFDFFAGTARQAPRWIRESGFEWLFRLCTQPKRLWKRYIIYGGAFVFYVTIQIVRHYLGKQRIAVE